MLNRHCSLRRCLPQFWHSDATPLQIHECKLVTRDTKVVPSGHLMSTPRNVTDEQNSRQRSTAKCEPRESSLWKQQRKAKNDAAVDDNSDVPGEPKSARC